MAEQCILMVRLSVVILCYYLVVCLLCELTSSRSCQPSYKLSSGTMYSWCDNINEKICHFCRQKEMSLNLTMLSKNISEMACFCLHPESKSYITNRYLNAIALSLPHLKKKPIPQSLLSIKLIVAFLLCMKTSLFNTGK